MQKCRPKDDIFTFLFYAMYGCDYGIEVFFQFGVGVGAVLGDNFDDCRADDDAVGILSDFYGVLYRGIEFLTDGRSRYLLGVLDGALQTDIEGTHVREKIDKALGLLANLLNALFGNGGYHVQDGNAVFFGDFLDLGVLLKGNIGNDNARNACLLTAGEKALVAVEKYGIGVGHEDERYFFINFFQQIENIVGTYAVLQGTQVGLLNEVAFGNGVGEGYADFDGVYAALL